MFFFIFMIHTELMVMTSPLQTKGAPIQTDTHIHPSRSKEFKNEERFKFVPFT